MDATLFATGLAVFAAAHQVADHVLGQTDRQAENKAKPGKVGWSAILGHVAQYHTVMLLMLLVTVQIFSLSPTWYGVLLALAFSFVSHAFIDRRWPVKWLLEHIGSPNFAKLLTPINGPYLADQGLHWFCLWVSAILLCL
jgi:hypothetical protein